jgi:hypothetical protein
MIGLPQAGDRCLFCQHSLEQILDHSLTTEPRLRTGLKSCYMRRSGKSHAFAISEIQMGTLLTPDHKCAFCGQGLGTLADQGEIFKPCKGRALGEPHIFDIETLIATKKDDVQVRERYSKSPVGRIALQISRLVAFISTRPLSLLVYALLLLGGYILGVILEDYFNLIPDDYDLFDVFTKGGIIFKQYQAPQ